VSAHVITANDLDLLTFFEVEPTPRDADVPWPYNDFLYETSRGDHHISFAVAPAYKDVRCILTVGGSIIYELNALGVDDVRYLKDTTGELLEVIVSARETVTLRLRPVVRIDHRVADASRPNT
jgi:hypothetical protein